jgi:poly(3-hydroxybutyrate) depolymerase
MARYKFLGKILAGGLLLSTVVVGVAEAKINELKDKGITLNIDDNDVAVSGISSGAAMATQLLITHAADLTGAGIVAGPPYRCANVTFGNPLSLGMVAPSVFAATQICTNAFGTKVIKIGDQDIAKLEGLTADVLDNTSYSDGWSELCGSRVVLISGAADTMVPADVTNASAEQYRWISAECVKKGLPALTLDIPPARPGMPHTMPTDSTAMPQNCPAGSPYIADCNYDGGAKILETLHPKAKAAAGEVKAKEQNLIRFNQNTITKYEGQMHKNGYIYVPDACQHGELCPMHVALHGCKQNEDQIGRKANGEKYLFARDAGYNDDAERLGIVVLYPQAANSDLNPSGCWDWWGYVDPSAFYRKDGIQLRTLWKVIDAARH